MSESNNLPDSWVTVKVSDVGTSITGNTPSTQNVENYGTSIPYIKPPQLIDRPIDSSKEFLSEQGAKLARVLPPFSVLVSCIGNLGKTGLNKMPVAFNQQINAIVPFKGISPAYLFYQAQSHSFRSQLESKATATTISIVNKGNFETVELNIAPFNEQHRIVVKIEELFSELDKGIENLKTARAQLKVYRQALLKHAFEGKLTAQWREQNRDKLETAAALLKRIQQERAQRYQQQLADWENKSPSVPLLQRGKTTSAAPHSTAPPFEKGGLGGISDSPLCKRGARGDLKPKAPKPLPPLTAEELAELPELPEGWWWFKVGHICDVVRGGSPRPAGDPKFYGGNIPFLKVADITNTSTPYLNSFTFTITEAGLSKTRQIEPNTLLLSNSGATLGVPKICLISATMNDGVAAFLGLPQEALLYHYYFWESKTEHLRNIDQGAAQPNLNTDLIKETFISICSPSEQIAVTQKLEAALSEVDQLDLTITTSLQQAEALRQSILKKAYAGQLVPQDPHDEPASKLLARIKAERDAQSAKHKLPNATRKSL